MFDFEKYCDIDKNKYYRWYVSIIDKRIKTQPEDNYCEKHHVVPKCVGTCDLIVKLSAREHFIVHLLLPKFIVNNKYKKKLIYALWGICHQSNQSQNRITINSKTYESIKKSFSKRISGDNHWMKDPERRRKLSEKKKGTKMPEYTKKKLSDIFTGREVTWGDKIGDSNRGKKRTDKMNQAQSRMMKQRYASGLQKNPNPNGSTRKKEKCPYCNEMVDCANMKRWHNKDSNCVLRLQRKQNKPGKRGSAKTHKREPRNRLCPSCGKNYTNQYFKNVHSKHCF